MGWGEPHRPADGTGTTGQIEEAHRALDLHEVPAGPLALRVLTFVGMLDRMTTEGVRHAD